MNDVRFPEPVVLEFATGKRQVATSYEAIECLRQQWPEWARGRSWRSAYRTCRDALDGWRNPTDAWRTFLKAARRADLLASDRHAVPRRCRIPSRHGRAFPPSPHSMNGHSAVQRTLLRRSFQASNRALGRRTSEARCSRQGLVEAVTEVHPLADGLHRQPSACGRSKRRSNRSGPRGSPSLCRDELRNTVFDRTIRLSSVDSHGLTRQICVSLVERSLSFQVQRRRCETQPKRMSCPESRRASYGPRAKGS